MFSLLPYRNNRDNKVNIEQAFRERSEIYDLGFGLCNVNPYILSVDQYGRIIPQNQLKLHDPSCNFLPVFNTQRIIENENLQRPLFLIDSLCHD